MPTPGSPRFRPQRRRVRAIRFWKRRPRSGTCGTRRVSSMAPAPAPTMQKWLAEGRVPGDGWCGEEGWADWQVASLIFPQLSTPPVPVGRGPVAAPFAPQPGMFPGPAGPAPAAMNDPFSFGASTAAAPSSPASQYIHQRRDNSKMMLIISIVLLFAIAIARRRPMVCVDQGQREDEEVAYRKVPACVSALQLQPDA